MKAILALEDGSYFEGEGFGAEARSEGEVCFNTSMTGYQEILTDPSYAGQIVTMTYPEIGNYGINPEDVESKSVQCRGFVIKHLCEHPSNWRAKPDKKSPWKLADYLKDNGIPGIQGIDTRKLVRILREQGVMNGILVHGEYDKKEVIEKAKSVPSLSSVDYVAQVSDKNNEKWDQGEHEICFYPLPKAPDSVRIAALDFGVKYNILRKLYQRGGEVVCFKANADAEQVLASNPDGIFLSNGPGDPETVDYAVKTIKNLVGKKPMFGICLGHQLLSLALGAKTFKLKFGHRGANHPIQDLRTGKVFITSQNHGFAVDPDSINQDELEITHINLNDNTVAGLRHKKLPIFSVQYHPEASPGPKESDYLFEEYFQAVRQSSAGAIKQNA